MHYNLETTSIEIYVIKKCRRVIVFLFPRKDGIGRMVTVLFDSKEDQTFKQINVNMGFIGQSIE